MTEDVDEECRKDSRKKEERRRGREGMKVTNLKRLFLMDPTTLLLIGLP